MSIKISDGLSYGEQICEEKWEVLVLLEWYFYLYILPIPVYIGNKQEELETVVQSELPQIWAQTRRRGH